VSNRASRQFDTPVGQGSLELEVAHCVGGVLSPLLSNVALSVLDDFVAQVPGGPCSTKVERARRRRHGLPNYRLVRYADDFLVLVAGTRQHAVSMRDQVAAALAPMGLRLSAEKTTITHIDQGLDFLGWRIQRHRKRGTNQHYVYTYPARKAVKAAKAKVKTVCRRMDKNQPLDALLLQLNRMLRGWCAYFRPGVSHAAFKYLGHCAWTQVIAWLRRKHRRITWKDLRRRYCGGGWWPQGDKRELFNPNKVRTTRYPYRGAAIPTPWPTTG
jgi:RNA-directed DNA polymerase